MTQRQTLIDAAANARPILIAGPTASGKSALALEIAATHGGAIVNADALQVFADWQVLTARPGAGEMAGVPHHLYGHVPGDAVYSAGHWLREVRALLGGVRPIIVGGTGLYFTALTEGLAEIPETPPDIRAAADALRQDGGIAALLAGIDAATAARLDRHNPMRVQRAWEVQQATGRGLAAWHAETGPPALPLGETLAILLEAERGWLSQRIADRFDLMLETGALDEARAHLADWDPASPSSKALGAAELIAYLRGEIDRETARHRATILTRQYAKRQRTWFRARMKSWKSLTLSSP